MANAAKERLERVRKEVEAWGATVSFDLSRRHIAANINFRGASRKVFMSQTPSDPRAFKNILCTVRKELRTLGAQQGENNYG